MCRLAYIPRPFARVGQWLKAMERSNGGHGCGVAMSDYSTKGTGTSAADTADIIRQAFDATRRAHKRHVPVLWHTRFTSSGGHHDELCHPFKCDGGWLAHNGHWGLFHDKAAKLRKSSPGLPMSDTRLFSLMVDRSGFEKAVLKWEPPGVWLHMNYDGDLAVWKGSGSLVYCPEFGAFGSEAHTTGTWRDVALGLTERGCFPKTVGQVRQESWKMTLTRRGCAYRI